MANKRSLKKDIDYLVYEVVSDCFTVMSVKPADKGEELAEVISDAVILRNELIARVNHPDGKACITGKCGDTMEIRLKFYEDRVSKTSHWTDGCAYSLNCVLAAANLARGKTPDEIFCPAGQKGDGFVLMAPVGSNL